MIQLEEIQLDNGCKLNQYTITKSSGAKLQVINYGGIVKRIEIPDQHGRLDNICLGFENSQDYFNEHPYFGALIGRFGNRIAKGQFKIGENKYQVPVNNGENSLHGGLVGFDKVFWNVDVDGDDLYLSHRSLDGDQGYPGNLDIEVCYKFSEDHVWSIDYKATTDQATPINLTQHAYFNLKGAGKGNVLNHEVEFMAEHFTPVDDALIPTGEISSVKNTEFDFLERAQLKERFDQGFEFDHNMVLNDSKGVLQKAATVFEETTERVMELWTTEPGFQFYTGNFLDGSLKNSIGSFEKWGGFCLEAQNFPDAVNKTNFPNSILRPGETYTQHTEYRF